MTWLPGDTVAENLIAASGVVVAVTVIWAKAIRPARNGIKKALATIDRVEVAVKKTEQQTNGDLNAKFACLTKQIDGIRQGQDELRSLVTSTDGAIALHIDKFHTPKEIT